MKKINEKMWKSSIAVVAMIVFGQTVFGSYILGYKCYKNLGGFTIGCDLASCPNIPPVPCVCSKITFTPGVNVCVTEQNYSCDPSNCNPQSSNYEIYSGTCWNDSNGVRYCKWDGSPMNNGIGYYCCSGYGGGEN